MSKETKSTRKLRAILSADVKGYSLLMADDETFTIKTLKKYRDIMSEQIVQHNGRVVDSPGDNILADFASVVDAVTCAVEVQKILKEKNENLPDDKRLEFRIGVNIGDVIQDEDRIYGHGVNVAARIEGLAEPSGVCISRNAYDHIRDKLKLGYDYLGEHSLKNIKHPVRVYKLLMDPKDSGKLVGIKKKRSAYKWVFAAGGAFVLIIAALISILYFKYWLIPTPENIDPEDKMAFDLPKGPSVAVMPFDNMTGDQDFDYFCDGITRNVISSLSYLPELFVIAYNSTSAYKGKQVNTQQISRDLGSRYIIEGSIQRSADIIRITVQLIDAETGFHKWSEAYDRKPDDIFQVQDDIAFEILKSLDITMKSRGTYKKQYNDAYNFQEYKKYLKALHNLGLLNPESNNLAQNAATELIDAKPENPLAYSLLARSYVQNLMSGRCESALICLGKATENIRNALFLDNTLDHSHETAGHIFLMRKEHDKAIDSLKMAINLNPSYANAYNNLGYVYIYADELDRAIDNIKKAIRLNPLPPSWYYFCLGFAYQNSKQFEKAIEAYNKCLEINPDNWATLVGMVVIYGHMGEKEKAKAAISELYRVRPNFSKSYFLKIMPFKKQSSRDFVGEGLTKAGLPD